MNLGGRFFGCLFESERGKKNSLFRWECVFSEADEVERAEEAQTFTQSFDLTKLSKLSYPTVLLEQESFESLVKVSKFHLRFAFPLRLRTSKVWPKVSLPGNFRPKFHN